jgi:hypothetical protein
MSGMVFLISMVGLPKWRDFGWNVLQVYTRVWYLASRKEADKSFIAEEECLTKPRSRRRPRRRARQQEQVLMEA